MTENRNEKLEYELALREAHASYQTKELTFSEYMKLRRYIKEAYEVYLSTHAA